MNLLFSVCAEEAQNWNIKGRIFGFALIKLVLVKKNSSYNVSKENPPNTNTSASLLLRVIILSDYTRIFICVDDTGDDPALCGGNYSSVKCGHQ